LRKILALLLIFSLLFVAQFLYDARATVQAAETPVVTLKGVLCMWNLKDLNESQIDFVTRSGANTFAFFVDQSAYNNKTIGNAHYVAAVNTKVNICRQRGLKILIFPYDGLSDSFTNNETRWQRYGKIIADENMTQQWIAAWSKIIQELQPDAFSILYQAPDANFTGCGDKDIPGLNYARYKVFAQECIDACRSKKDDLIIYMSSMPFHNMAAVAADPIDRPNIFYYYLLYGQSSSDPREYGHSYNIGNLTLAKTQLYQYVSDRSVGQALAANLSVAVVTCAEYRVNNTGTTNSGFSNADAFLDDMYQLCRDYKIESVFQGGFNSEDFEYGMWDPTLTTLNLVGNAWLKNMSPPTSPPLNYMWFLLVGGTVAVLGYYARFKRKRRTVIESEGKIEALPIDHLDRARARYTNDVLDRQKKIKRFERKYSMTIRPSEKFEDALVKIGVPLSTQAKKKEKKPVQA
jgi:hypothetical protein